MEEWNPYDAGVTIKFGTFSGPDGSVWRAYTDAYQTTYTKVSDGYSGETPTGLASGEGIAQENTYSRDPYKAAGYYDDPETAQFFRKWADKWEESVGITFEEWKAGKYKNATSKGKWARKFNKQSSIMKSLGFGDAEDFLVESPEGLSDPAAAAFIQERNRQAQEATLYGAKTGTSRFTTS